jgi:hypothetical protein
MRDTLGFSRELGFYAPQDIMCDMEMLRYYSNVVEHRPLRIEEHGWGEPQRFNPMQEIKSRMEELEVL